MYGTSSKLSKYKNFYEVSNLYCWCAWIIGFIAKKVGKKAQKQNQFIRSNATYPTR